MIIIIINFVVVFIFYFNFKALIDEINKDCISNFIFEYLFV
jgi:hypothetical protein